MGTRSMIGVQNADGSIEAVYCHWDGYIGHNGRMLVFFHNTEKAAREIIALGNLSCLREKLHGKHDHAFDRGCVDREKGYGNLPCHSITRAYGRDRGEVDFKAREFANLKAYCKDGEEYGYLFTGGRWVLAYGGGNGQENRTVAELLAEDLVDDLERLAESREKSKNDADAIKALDARFNEITRWQVACDVALQGDHERARQIASGA